MDLKTAYGSVVNNGFVFNGIVLLSITHSQVFTSTRSSTHSSLHSLYLTQQKKKKDTCINDYGPSSHFFFSLSTHATHKSSVYYPHRHHILLSPQHLLTNSCNPEGGGGGHELWREWQESRAVFLCACWNEHNLEHNLSSKRLQCLLSLHGLNASRKYVCVCVCSRVTPHFLPQLSHIRVPLKRPLDYPDRHPTPGPPRCSDTTSAGTLTSCHYHTRFMNLVKLCRLPHVSLRSFFF